MTISPFTAGDPLEDDEQADRDSPLGAGWSYDLVPPGLEDDLDDELDEDDYELWSRD